MCGLQGYRSMLEKTLDRKEIVRHVKGERKPFVKGDFL